MKNSLLIHRRGIKLFHRHRAKVGGPEVEHNEVTSTWCSNSDRPVGVQDDRAATIHREGKLSTDIEPKREDQRSSTMK